jgi:hypothetical protein
MRCKFTGICDSYRPDSYTCTHEGGGDYCGKYRQLNEQKLKEIEDTLEFQREEIASLQRRIKKMERLP